MIDVKDAVRASIAYLRNFEEFNPLSPGDIRLEETEYEDTGYWLITLSFTEDALSRRKYKIFKIDENGGEVKWMKVRTLQPIE